MPSACDIIHWFNVGLTVACLVVIIILLYRISKLLFSKNDGFSDDKLKTAQEILNKIEPMTKGGDFTLNRLKSMIPDKNPDAVLYTDLKKLFKEKKLDVDNIARVL